MTAWKNNIVQAEVLRKLDYRNEQAVKWIKYTKKRSRKVITKCDNLKSQYEESKKPQRCGSYTPAQGKILRLQGCSAGANYRHRPSGYLSTTSRCQWEAVLPAGESDSQNWVQLSQEKAKTQADPKESSSLVAGLQGPKSVPQGRRLTCPYHR